MNGMAGTGKTTIMYSFCEWLEANRQLGANFCCSRLSPSCHNVNNIVPTLAYQLARYSPAFRSALCKVLEEEPDIGKLRVVLQFAKLVKEPLQKVKDAMPEGVIVAIDALDKCEDSSGVRMVLETLLKFVSNLPIKFFVTSRQYFLFLHVFRRNPGIPTDSAGIDRNAGIPAELTGIDRNPSSIHYQTSFKVYILCNNLYKGLALLHIV